MRLISNFFSEEAWFGLQGYINMKNNRSCNSQNPRLTHEVWLHPRKLGVWHAVRARRIAQPAFFNRTINCKKYVQVILVQFFPELTEGESFYGWFQQDSATVHIACMSMQTLIPSETEISARVFGRHIHPTLILIIFSSGVHCRTKFKTENPINSKELNKF
jgi:hypothetical protein